MNTCYDFSKKGDRVRYALEQSGLNPTSAAKAIGCTSQAIQGWLSEATENIKNELLYKFADLTKFEARWIAIGEGPQRSSNTAQTKAIERTVTLMLAMTPEQQYLVARLANQVTESPPNEANG